MNNDRKFARTVVWEVATGKEVWAQEYFSIFDEVPSGVAFSPDGKRLAYIDCSESTDPSVPSMEALRVRDLDSGRVLWTHRLFFRGFGWLPRGFVFSPSGDAVAVATSGGALVLDAQTGAELYEPNVQGDVQAVAFRPKGNVLAIAHGEQIETVDYRAKRTLSTLKGHGGKIWALSFSPHGRLASVSQDSTVRLWDEATAQSVLTLPGRLCVAFSPDGNELATGAPNAGAAVLWNFGPR
jgi:WD40 repeat protein